MRHAILFTLAHVALVGAAAPAQSEVASPWNAHPNAKTRLIAGEGRMLGVEMQLAPGWKTYWRMPGDAGVPPSFDWTGSDNIKAADVLYPAPSTMRDAAGVAVGYQDAVVFPVKVTPVADGKPIKVVLEFSFGVCKDICIPVDSKLSLTLDGAAAWPASPALKTYLKRVPTVATDIGKPGALITSITQGGSPGKPVLTVGLAGRADVHVEAPDGLFVPLPTYDARGATIDLAASPDVKDLIGKALHITVVGSAASVETTYVLK